MCANADMIVHIILKCLGIYEFPSMTFRLIPSDIMEKRGRVHGDLTKFDDSISIIYIFCAGKRDSQLLLAVIIAYQWPPDPPLAVYSLCFTA